MADNWISSGVGIASSNNIFVTDHYSNSEDSFVL